MGTLIFLVIIVILIANAGSIIEFLMWLLAIMAIIGLLLWGLSAFLSLPVISQLIIGVSIGTISLLLVALVYEKIKWGKVAGVVLAFALLSFISTVAFNVMEPRVERLHRIEGSNRRRLDWIAFQSAQISGNTLSLTFINYCPKCTNPKISFYIKSLSGMWGKTEYRDFTPCPIWNDEPYGECRFDIWLDYSYFPGNYYFPSSPEWWEWRMYFSVEGKETASFEKRPRGSVIYYLSGYEYDIFSDKVEEVWVFVGQQPEK